MQKAFAAHRAGQM